MAFDDDLGLSVLSARAGYLRRRAAGEPQPQIFAPKTPAAGPAAPQRPTAMLRERLTSSVKDLAGNFWARIRKTYGG